MILQTKLPRICQHIIVRIYVVFLRPARLIKRTDSIVWGEAIESQDFSWLLLQPSCFSLGRVLSHTFVSTSTILTLRGLTESISRYGRRGTYIRTGYRPRQRSIMGYETPRQQVNYPVCVFWPLSHVLSPARSEYLTIASIVIVMTAWDFVVGVLFGIVVSCKPEMICIDTT